jgi:hypothetical protein
VSSVNGGKVSYEDMDDDDDDMHGEDDDEEAAFGLPLQPVASASNRPTTTKPTKH